MNHELSNLVRRLLEAGGLTDGDVLALRDGVWTEEAIGLDVVDALFRLNDHCGPLPASWTGFFVETVRHAMLNQTPPLGFIDEASAAWLRAKVDREGRIASLGEIELIVSIIEGAENAPEALKFYALTQIEATIASGRGPTRNGGVLRPNCVDEAEVSLLRRLIFAAGGEGAVVVGTQEADMLLRIKNTTLKADNAPGWLQLFVQGVGNHLMAHSDYRPLARDEAVRLNSEMERNSPSVASFFRRMLPADMLGRGTILEAFKGVFPRGDDLFAHSAAVNAARQLTSEEAGWLKTHIVADGQTDAYEKALMTFIIDEIGNTPAPLADLARRRA